MFPPNNLKPISYVYMEGCCDKLVLFAYVSLDNTVFILKSHKQKLN